MSKFRRKSFRAWLVGSMLLAGLICFSSMTASGQETLQDNPPASADAPTDTAAEPQDAATVDAPAADTTPADPPPDDVGTSTANAPADETSDNDPPATDLAPDSSATATPPTPVAEDDDPPQRETSLPAGKTQPSIASEAMGSEDGKAGAEAGSGWRTLGVGIGLLALFVVPMYLGSYLTRAWKMPDHGWKISLVLVALTVSIVVCLFGTFKFGPDLAGGITLVYELADAQAAAPETDTETDPDAQQDDGKEFDMSELIGALKRRLDPDGTKEITIREYGPAVEIIIPETGQDELEYVKSLITRLGSLEFRIVADSSIPEDRRIIDQARQLPPSQKELRIGGNKVAEWVAYDLETFGPVDQEGDFAKRDAAGTPEALVLMDQYQVTGDHLTSVTKGLDEVARPAVHFAFNRDGARRFRRLTSENKPNEAHPNVRRKLGILLDKTLVNAPEIRETISDRGMISGGSMTDKEVEQTIQVLKAGRLPTNLNKTPISEQIISPTLGAVTVEKGKMAIGIALLAVVLFMLVYYRFAGFVACLALTFNLLLVLALMVLLKAAFTLPGLAGLVLTIGMSVDANVLIYERIREELRSGAALRMAIRNGFSRALSAIIDSNVTTIIAGVALYYIGTDQVKGFAVTLILGILTSMFSAIFFARLVFDVAERRGWIKEVRMMKLMSQPNIDFLGARWVAGAISTVVILIGLVAVYFRGGQMLDIDFTGGSSVTFTLNESARMPITDVRNVLMNTELAEKNLLLVELGKTNTRYSIDTSEQSVDSVKDIISDEFGDKLMRYSLEYSDVKPYTEGQFSGTEARLTVNKGSGYTHRDGISHNALREWIERMLAKAGHEGNRPTLMNPEYRPGSGARFQEWTVRLVGLDEAAARSVLDSLQADMRAEPLFPSANKIGGRVSADMQSKALLAVAVSLVGVIGYLWLRFQKVTYGLAAGAALVHDVLVTIGMMALSGYIVQWVPPLADALQLESFQISLTIVAALLTIIGYSLNDTIVTFDRLREIKGKSPQLTPEMVNSSVNQTLSRTILTATTVFLVVVILYFFGGEGIHSFAFAFLVGVIAGTYSTIFIAAPVLLWLDRIGRKYFSGASAATARSPRRGAGEAARS